MNLNKRNHGYGRRIDYAGRQVLRERYADGHDATRRTHAERWRRLTAQLRTTYGIRDMRDITPTLLSTWAQARLAKGRATRTVANEISTANIILGHARRGGWRTVRPSRVTGPRDDVRRTVPASLAPARDYAARLALTDTPRAAAVYALAHAAGLRSREASLADLERLTREAGRHGAINIQEGTKGGRSAPRWLPVTPAIRHALATARAVRPAGSRNLLRPDETYKQWRDGDLRDGREALKQVGIPGYHDARAAHACHRYAQLTGCDAPVVTGRRTAARPLDRAARRLIAHELGHGRMQIAASYVGTAA